LFIKDFTTKSEEIETEIWFVLQESGKVVEGCLTGGGL